MTRLAETLTRQLEERMRERPLVVWLDREGLYTSFVDGLRPDSFRTPVVRFRGSYLETLLALEGYENRIEPEPLLLHLPGHNDTSVRKTPFLELYLAGTRWERSLDTLVREASAGVVRPEDVDAFLANRPADFKAAEDWLESEGSRDRRGIADVLATLDPKWVFDELLGRGGDLRKRLEQEPDPGDVQDYFARHVGFSREFAAFLSGTPQPADLRTLTDALVAWVLCVEYVHDLRRAPSLEALQPLRKLSAPLRDASLALTRRLRESHPEIYGKQTLVTEEQLKAELAAGSPEDLGRIDTFSGEDVRLLEAAIVSLKEGRWSQAREWAEQRLGGKSYWLEREPARRHEWELVLNAAVLGAALVEAGRPLEKARSLEEAVSAYTGASVGARRDGAQAVDRAHRHFEELRRRKLGTQLRHASELWEVAAGLRVRYRAWADELARDFSTLCEEHGFLPEASLRQRTLFEQVVHPLLQRDGGRSALFMVDALRFEMAAELASTLEGPGVSVHLGARLAELPSITAVGMNALAPVASGGRLVLAPSKGKGASVFGGFRAGEYTVRDPATRVRAMAERSLEKLPGNRKSPPDLVLSDLVDLDQETLARKCQGQPLVIVHSTEIDDAGEASLGLFTFDTWLGQLKAAVQKLRSVGVAEFVITSDHGFLLQDETTLRKDYGGGIEQDRRWALLGAAVSEPDLTGATLSSLGYEGAAGYLRLARDTRVFDSSARSSATFVHGGNSLQERVIPVMTVTSRVKSLDRITPYVVRAEVLAPALGHSRIRVRLEAGEGFLQLAAGRKLPLAIRSRERGAQVQIKDAPGAELVNQRVLVPCDADWVEVLFSLVGGVGRTQIEVFHPDADEDVTPCLIPSFFDVVPVQGQAPGAVVAEGDGGWHASIADGAHLKVLQYIEKYGSINEEQSTQMLGSPREARRFGRNVTDYLQLLPFRITIETAGGDTRYVKI